MRLQEIETRLSAIKAELENDNADVDALEKEVEGLKEERKNLQAEKRSKIITDISSGAGNPMPGFMPKIEVKEECRGAKSPEYRNAFMKRLLGQELNDVEKREFAYTNGGGNATSVVPIETANSIFDMMTKVAPMINEITLLHIPGSVRIPVQGTMNAATVHVENAPMAAAADTVTNITLGAYEFMKVQSISATVRAMSIPAFEAWLVSRLAEQLGLVLESEIIIGTNVTDGIETNNVWVNNTTGIDYGAAVTYDNLCALIALLPSRYDRNAKWLMNKAMFYNQIAMIQDANGNPIVVKDPVNAAAMRLMGYPVLISDVVGAGNAYLGDYKVMWGNMSQDVSIESDASSGFLSNSINFRGTCIFDCDAADNAAFRKLFT